MLYKNIIKNRKSMWHGPWPRGLKAVRFFFFNYLFIYLIGSVVILAFRVGLREYFRLIIVLATYHEKITKQNCKVVIYNYVLCRL